MNTTTTQTARNWTDTLRVQVISLVILLGSAAAFGLAHPEPGAVPAPAAPVADHPVHVLAVADGASCGVDPEPAAPVAPVSAARRVFGAARCTE